MKTIFVITTIRPEYNTRQVGWYERYDKAEEAVLNNLGDIYEDGHWIYCNIEEIPGNRIYPCPPVKEQWFKWSNKNKAYKKIEKPDQYKRTVNFSIG